MINLEVILFAFLFFGPAGIANATPIFSNKVPLLNKWHAPLDFGISVQGRRLLGPNKTWRGLLTGVAMGTLTGYALSQIYFTDYDTTTFVLMSMSMSFGALFGDAVESFFKRMRGIASGKAWFPFDQTDYIIGGLLFTLPFATVSFTILAWVFVLYFGLHLLFSYVGYLLGLKTAPI